MTHRTPRAAITAGLLTVLLSSAAVIGGASPALAAELPSTQDHSGPTTSPSELSRVLAKLAELGKAAQTAETASQKATIHAQRAARAARAASTARDDAEARARKAAIDAEVSRARASSAAAQLARSGSTSQDATGLILQGLGAQRTLWGLSRMSELSVSSTKVFSEAAAADAAAEASATLAAHAASEADDRASKARAAAATAKKRYSAVIDLIARQRARAQELSAQSEVLSSAGAAAVTVSGSVASTGWVAPVAGTLRDGFGPRPNMPVAGVSPFHRGQDIAAPCGTVIEAASSGTVVQAGYLGSYGNLVLLNNSDGVQTGYAHATRLLVHPGQKVVAGRPISTVGSTGAASGCHLHFEVRIRGVAVDPTPFMAGRNAPLNRP